MADVSAISPSSEPWCYEWDSSERSTTDVEEMPVFEIMSGYKFVDFFLDNREIITQHTFTSVRKLKGEWRDLARQLAISYGYEMVTS
uniref:MADF domain-containing protein n=1 Tax=Angiostrongylus cantonensis TaxID=6313 RepID=A0A0K0DIQ7_ANGCA